MKRILLYIFTLMFVNIYSQKKYEAMMLDTKINFYDVVQEGETYFKTHNKNKKGSGWKDFKRWINNNEYKYYPSGDRSRVDPLFVEKAYTSFLKEKSKTNRIANFDNGWNELGPRYIDNVVGGYSTGLGRIEDFYIDATNTNKMYIASRSGGLWKTLDGGISWEALTDFVLATGVTSFTVSPTNFNEIFINVSNSKNNFSNGVYHSIDGGNSWTISNFNPINLGFGGLGDNFIVNSIQYHPTVSNLIFISTNKGIYKSTDNLNTWSVLYPNSDIRDVVFHPTNPSIIYFNGSVENDTSTFVYFSNNQGLSYTKSNSLSGNTGLFVHLSTSQACPNCVYAISYYGIWKSTNNGTSFSYLNASNVYTLDFVVSDLDNTIMLTGGADIVISEDEGQTFNQVTNWNLLQGNGDVSSNQTAFNTNTDYVHADLRKAKCIHGVFYVATDGFLSKSIDNGVTWEKLSQGIGIRENYKLGVSQSNYNVTVCGSQDNGTSIKKENGWTEFFGADGMEAIVHPLNENWIIASYQDGGRVRTKNGTILESDVTPINASADWEAPLAYYPNNPMTVFDFRTIVYRSLDFASAYSYLGNIFNFNTIKQAAIAENNSDIILISDNNKILKSIDGGFNWIDITGTLPNEIIQDIAFDPKDDDTFIVSYATYQNNNQKIFLTTNGGTSWSNITYNLGNLPIHSVVIDHTADKNIYIGSEIGIYTKPMNATVWNLYNQNLPNVAIEELEIMYGSNTIRAATWGRGLWEYSLVNRNNFPAIQTIDITSEPTDDQPKYGIDQFVTATIDYDATLTDVHVAWSVNNLNFDHTITMTNTSGNIWVSDTAIPNYAQGSKIYFKVFATGNNNDTSETYKFMYKVKPYGYCNVQSQYLNVFISNVTFNTINNNSDGNEYQDFTYIATDVIKGQVYDFNVTYTDNSPYDQVAVWIDFNHDTDFNDAGEEFILQEGLGSNSPYTYSIPIPNDATLGQTRMRVRVLNRSYESFIPPCGTTVTGETEDYTINILDNNVSVSENNFSDTLSVFPNPTSKIIHINLGNMHKNISIKVSNALGQIITSKKYLNIENIDLELNAKAGLYFIEIKSEKGEKAIFKIALKK